MKVLEGAGVELRATGDRAVLVGLTDQEEEREVDPGNLAIERELVVALHEWARVAHVVRRTAASGDDKSAGTVVSHRGRQLAGRLAAALGSPVRYADPISGRVC